ILAKPCAVRMSASEPSGRAVASASCAPPYRPMPSPPTALRPKSTFLCRSENKALAPTPPPVALLFVAPKLLTTVGVGDAHPITVGTAGFTVSPALVPTTPQG